MVILRKSSLSTFNLATAVTIGAFDGVHRGHQYILNKLKQVAHDYNLTPVVIYFEPQPKEFFLKENAPKRLTTFRNRVALFKQFGIETVLCLNFNEQLKNLNAEDFVKTILSDGLNAKHILIGDDFRFGKDQLGNIDLLIQLQSKYQYTVDRLSSYYYQNQRISSSMIRERLLSNQIEKANQLLGYPYHITGKISHGDKNGRKLGFSTINIHLKHSMVVSGVYVVRVSILGQSYFGVANIGIRPTLNGVKRLLEVHLLNFNNDVYLQIAQVEFLHWLRNEVKFANLDELKTQIAIDVNHAKSWLNANIQDNHLEKEKYFN